MSGAAQRWRADRKKPDINARNNVELTREARGHGAITREFHRPLDQSQVQRPRTKKVRTRNEKGGTEAST